MRRDWPTQNKPSTAELKRLGKGRHIETHLILNNRRISSCQHTFRQLPVESLEESKILEQMPWDETLQGCLHCLSFVFFHLKKVFIPPQALKFLRSIHAEMDRPKCTLSRGLSKSLMPLECRVKMWVKSRGHKVS